MTYKISTKVATNRLNLVANKVDIPTHIVIVKGHFLEGVVILHETIHKIEKKKILVLEVDSEKDFEK